jgi:cell wall-associated NlpC family hydrolase
MTSRADVVAEARSWIGTPFHHQGRLKGVGVDCAGVAVGTARALGLEYADAEGYARIPSGGQFMATVESVTDAVSFLDVLPGDLMIFAFAGEPQHIAIVSDFVGGEILLVHAWSAIGWCVENRLDTVWKSRLRGCRRFRGLA